MNFPISAANVHFLPNGFTLILDPDATAPVVSAQLWVQTGSIHEEHLLGSGLSHFLEHMVFKGTKDFSASELADTVQAAGGHWNAYTSLDRTVYYINGPSSSLPTFLKCLTGLVFFPTLPEDEFTKEKDVIRREIDMGLDDPDHFCYQQLTQTLFHHDPRKFPVIGYRHCFDALTYQDLIDYHRRRYTTNRCFMVISGDFDPDTIKDKIIELTESCPQGAGPEPFIPNDPPLTGPRSSHRTFAVPHSKISLSWRIPCLEHPDAPAYEVLANIIGQGRSSFLYQHLREETNLALEISTSAWLSSHRDGIFSVHADAPVANREELIEKIHQTIEGLPNADLTSALAKAKRQILVSQFSTLTTASGRASDLASNWHEARDIQFTRSFLIAVDRVTIADVLRVATTLDRQFVSCSIVDPLDTPPPQTSSTKRRKQHEVEIHTLQNGMQIAMVHDARVPMFHLYASIRSGRPAETPELQGINHLLSNTLTKGTHSRSAKSIAQTLESIGASCNTDVGNNSILTHAGGLTADMKTILEIFADIMIHPVFDSAGIQREKNSQLAILEEALQSPFHRCSAKLRQAVFSDRGYGLSALGTPESLQRITRRHLLQHHSSLFNTHNTTLAIAGSFNPTEVLELLNSQLQNYPIGKPFTPPPSTLQPATTCHEVLDKKQAALAIAFPSAPATHLDRFALTAIQEYASDMAGPLFGRIREELGLAYQIGASQFLGFDAGLFSFFLATAPEQLDLAKSELMAEIEKIASNGIPDTALEQVRATILSSIALQQQSSSFIAKQVCLDLMFHNPPDQFRKNHEIYQNLSAETIRETAHHYLSQTPTISTTSPHPR